MRKKKKEGRMQAAREKGGKTDPGRAGAKGKRNGTFPG